MIIFLDMPNSAMSRPSKSLGALPPDPRDFPRHNSVSEGGNEMQRPLNGDAAQGPVRLGAPSIRLFLVRLRPRRA